MKKKNRTIIATGITLLLLCSGTYAWQSISQVVKTTESGYARNPGGRLHDDFDGDLDKKVYIENYQTEVDGGAPIYGRIRIDEYLEMGTGAGVEGENRDTEKLTILRGAILNDSYPDLEDKTTWDTYEYSETGYVIPWGTRIGTYRTLTFGGKGLYLPTTNKDNENLEPDFNGTWDNKYEDYIAYTMEDTGVKETPHSSVMSMAQWLELDYDEKIGPFWVFDEDGWAYWADSIEPEETTGLLIDSIIEVEDPPSSWYYGVNVVSQLASKGEWGTPETEETPATGVYAEGGITKEGLYVLNKAAGLHQVDSLLIVNPDGTHISEELIYLNYTDRRDFSVDLTVSYGVEIEDESQVIWSIEELEPGATQVEILEEEDGTQTEGEEFSVLTQKALDGKIVEGQLIPGVYMAGGTYRIKATSALDPTVYDTVDVKIMKAVGSISIESYRGVNQMQQGDKDKMEVVFHDMMEQDIIWSIEGHTSQNTTLDDSGLLIIGEDEQEEHAITIIATPQYSPLKATSHEVWIGKEFINVDSLFTNAYPVTGDPILVDGRNFYVIGMEMKNGRPALQLLLTSPIQQAAFNSTTDSVSTSISHWYTSSMRRITLPAWISTYYTLTTNVASVAVETAHAGTPEMITNYEEAYLLSWDELEALGGYGSSIVTTGNIYWLRTPRYADVSTTTNNTSSTQTITAAGILGYVSASTTTPYIRPVLWIYL